MWHSDNKAGGLKHELFRKVSLEVSFVLPDTCTLFIRNKSFLKDVEECHVNRSLKQTHTSQSDDNSITLWRGEKERQAAAEKDEGRLKRDRGGTMPSKTEKGKQFLCVSHQFSVVQFLLLSSTGNNYQGGWLPGQLSLFSLLHASKCFLHMKKCLMHVNQYLENVTTNTKEPVFVDQIILQCFCRFNLNKLIRLATEVV